MDSTICMWYFLITLCIFGCFVSSDEEPKESHSVCDTALPHNCTCNTTVLHCTKLTQFPSDLPQADEFIFTKSDLFVLKEIPNEYKNLKALRLVGNNIYHISDFAFKNLGELQNLVISNPFYTELTSKTFAGLNRLEYVSLHGTPIFELRSGVFGDENMPKLMDIKLSSCRIHSLEQQVFANASNLQQMSLPNNNLHSILNLTRNSVLKKLATLELHHNRITDLRGLTNMPSLRKLYLHHNNLAHVASDAFNALAETLSVLDLSYNSITGIEHIAFMKLTQLKELHLDHNKLTHILWEELPASLTIISLSENEWSCDCKNAFLVEANKPIIDSKQLKCTSPEELAGKSIEDVPKKKFLCESHANNHPNSHGGRNVAIALSVLGCLLVLVIGVIVYRRIKLQRRRRRQAGVYINFSSDNF